MYFPTYLYLFERGSETLSQLSKRTLKHEVEGLLH